MDALYVLGKGSKWNNNELRYSIRSLIKHASHINNIIIVGEDPGIYKLEPGGRIIHLPFADRHTPAQNIWHKIAHSCTSYFKESFMFMNDDYFFIKDLPCFLDHSPDIPYYYNGLLSDGKRIQRNNNYSNLIIKTSRLMQANDNAQKFFDIHYPMIIDPFLFMSIYLKYKKEIDHSQGILFKSTYCNEIGITGVATSDVKISQKYELKQIENILEGQTLFSISDNALNDTMKNFLYTKFHTKFECEI